MVYLTIGTLWKNEWGGAFDFLRYHRSIGCQKFVIYDREYNRLAEMFKNEPDVEIHHFPENLNNIHSTAWANLIGHCKGRTKWLACIDADQCLVPVQTDNVCDVLREYEQFASLQINWSTFGSSGHLKKTEGSLYERFTMRARLLEPLNNHCQFLCQPDRSLAIKTNDPHHCQLNPGEIAVNTNKQQIKGPFNIPPLHDKLYVAHYINKSREEAEIKWTKGRADIHNQKMPKDLFDLHETICNVEKEERVLQLWNKANGK